VNLWDELSGGSSSFKFDHCYFESNEAQAHGKDISLTLNNNHFASINSSFNHSLSRTRWIGDSPSLLYRQTLEGIFNNLLAYSHGHIYVSTQSRYGDVVYCACVDADYHCLII
jgi:hypothetical protein